MGQPLQVFMLTQPSVRFIYGPSFEESIKMIGNNDKGEIVLWYLPDDMTNLLSYESYDTIL